MRGAPSSGTGSLPSNMLNRFVHWATLVCPVLAHDWVVVFCVRSAFDWLNEFEAAETFFPEPSHKASGKKQVNIKFTDKTQHWWNTSCFFFFFFFFFVYFQQILRLADFVQGSVKSDVDRALQGVDIDTAMRVSGGEKCAATSPSSTDQEAKATDTKFERFTNFQKAEIYTQFEHWSATESVITIVPIQHVVGSGLNTITLHEWPSNERINAAD